MNRRVTQAALALAAALLTTVVTCAAGQLEEPTDKGETEQKTGTVCPYLNDIPNLF